MTRQARAQQKLETRSSLLRSATELCCRHGVQGTSVQEVSDGAGFTKGAFYSHFESKEDLFLEMLDDQFSEQLERLDALLTGSGDPSEEAGHAAAELMRAVSGDHEWRRLYFEFVAYAARNDRFRRSLSARHHELRTRLTEIYRRFAAALESSPPVPLQEVAAMTDFMADGFFLNQLIDPGIDDQLYGRMVSIFLRGLEAMEAEQRPDQASAASENGDAPGRDPVPVGPAAAAGGSP